MNINPTGRSEDTGSPKQPLKQVVDIQKKLAELPTDLDAKAQTGSEKKATSDKIPRHAGKVQQSVRLQELSASSSSSSTPSSSALSPKKSLVPEEIEEYFASFQVPLEKRLKEAISLTGYIIEILKRRLDPKNMQTLLKNLGFPESQKIDLSQMAMIKKFLHGALFVSDIKKFVVLIESYGLSKNDAVAIEAQLIKISKALLKELTAMIQSVEILDSINEYELTDFLEELLTSDVQDLLETVGLMVEAKQKAFEQAREEKPEMTTLRKDMKQKLKSSKVKTSASHHPFIAEINKEYQAHKAQPSAQRPTEEAPESHEKRVSIHSIATHHSAGPESQTAIPVKTDYTYSDYTKSTQEQRAKMSVKKMGEFFRKQIENNTSSLKAKGKPLTVEFINQLEETLEKKIDNYLSKMAMNDNPMHRERYLHELHKQINSLKSQLPTT